MQLCNAYVPFTRSPSIDSTLWVSDEPDSRYTKDTGVRGGTPNQLHFGEIIELSLHYLMSCCWYAPASATIKRWCSAVDRPAFNAADIA